MAKRRFMTKSDILASMKQVERARKSTQGAAWTGLLVIFNWVLHEEGWGQSRLADYNTKFNNMLSEYCDGNLDIEELGNKIYEKADFKVEYVPQDMRKGNKALDKFNNMLAECNNEINKQSSAYFTIHFNVLMEYGYGKVRLERNKDKCLDYVDSNDASNGGVIRLRQRLIDEVGIEIEMPIV